MPGIVAIVTAIAADVNARLLSAGLPALNDAGRADGAGSIPIGQVYVEENSVPPRIVMVPRASKFAPRSTPNRQAYSKTNVLAPGSGVRAYPMTNYGGGYSTGDTVTISAPDIAGGVQATAVPVFSNGSISRIVPTNVGSGYVNVPTVTFNTSTGSGATATAVLAPTLENLVQQQQRAIFTETVQFSCHTWGLGVGNSGSQAADFDAAQVLYQQLIASAYLLAPGIVRPTTGTWPESNQKTTQVDQLGHYFVFGLEIDTPVIDSPAQFVQGAYPLQAAPAGVRPNLTENIQSPTGTVETGFSGLG